MKLHLTYFMLMISAVFGVGCANITAPTGGIRDNKPPRLLQSKPNDSLLNTKVREIEFQFDEYVTLNDASKEVTISPLLPVSPVATSRYRTVKVKIADSLLEPETTYRISLGNAVKDLHEGNVFKNYSFTFSTGAYFDSLQVAGTLLDASTGLPDSNAHIALYSAKESDSVIIRKKPLYITKPDNNGRFLFRGLPPRKFKIYALSETNGNLTFDDPAERVAFMDGIVTAGDTARPLLRLFKQIDTSKATGTDTVVKNTRSGGRRLLADKPVSGYIINVDTTNTSHRSFDITRNIEIRFANKPELEVSRIALFKTVGDSQLAIHTEFIDDTAQPELLSIAAAWEGNMLYTLKLSKGFAKDSSGKELPPGKFVFRTNEDDDYGKLHIHLHGDFTHGNFLLLVKQENQELYCQPITDTNVMLARYKPGKYTLRVIADTNNNGKWDTGDLLLRRQPETVIAYPKEIHLKAGWEQSIDFSIP